MAYENDTCLVLRWDDNDYERVLLRTEQENEYPYAVKKPEIVLGERTLVNWYAKYKIDDICFDKKYTYFQTEEQAIIFKMEVC